MEHRTLPLVDHAPPTRVPARPMRVALVVMPWAASDRPSIQCGLLKAGLVRHGHQVTVHYLNLDLAASLGPDAYAAVAELGNERGFMLGEWLFTGAAFGRRSDEDMYRFAFPQVEDLCAEMGVGFDDLVRLRAEVLPRWLDKAIDAIDWSQYDIVGFSSMFEQHLAVLAGVAAVKRRAPAVPVVVGGANVDGEMGPEYLRHFTAIDFVAVGEADESLPALVAELSHGRSAPTIPGICRRDVGGVVTSSRPQPVRDLDALPNPDYSDYFLALDGHGSERVLGIRTPRLLIEFSRGCWWGQKHHCTFCGLNAMGMEYRSKSPQQAADELLRLAGTHRRLVIDAVDNILDMRYLSTFCAEVAAHGYDFTLFFEVKANLSPDQLGQLRAAGVTAIQPGLESLSSHVLRLMDKGTDMLTNVRLLKSALQHGIGVGWNILTGFPAETEEDYLDQARLIPALHHLQPPLHVGELRLERFSPYFTRPPAEFRNIRPAAVYRMLYPENGVDLTKIAYFFEYDADGRVPESVRGALHGAVDGWRERWYESAQPPQLRYERGPGWLRLIDTRSLIPQERYLDDWRADVYLGCAQSARTPAGVAAEVAGPRSTMEVRDFLDECVEDGLVVTERGRYLSLALSMPR